MEKNIADKAARWLAEKETGKPIRECFGEAPFAYRDWLLIPGEKQNPRLPEGAEEEWNALLLDVFARTVAYRKPETVLWDRLERLAQTLRRTSEKEKGVALVLRDNQALFPPPPLIGREAELLEIHGILEAKGRLLLWGMAGIGKSALARAYGARYRDTYASILLIPCECGLRKALADDGLVNISGLRYLPRGKRAEQGWYLRKKLACLRESTDSRTLLIDLGAIFLLKHICKLDGEARIYRDRNLIVEGEHTRLLFAVKSIHCNHSGHGIYNPVFPYASGPIS